ncbi:nodulin-like protein [Aureococcus anophagefferens]|uniref:Nodulin-like protein n=1 Tax=Aureococcus anophagefferens TaxID=44056 RepID=A0ABR1G123_AURAN
MMASTDAPPTACRWRILATVIVVESVGGLMYAFGIYSARLKSKFSLSQEQLDAISISSSLGSNVGVHWGLLTDAAGPSAALCAALVAGGGGWLLLWSALGGVSGLRGLPWAYLCAFALLQGTAMCGSDVASMTTIAKAFPQNRGRATGLVKAMVGLSAALAANVYVAVEPALRLYVLLIAGAYVGACAVGAARLRAGDILAAGARERPEDDAPRCSRGSSLASSASRSSTSALQLANAFAPVPAAGRYATGACAVLALVGGVAPVRSATALEAYGSADFWLLWFVCFAVCGSGTVVMNNLTQIAKAAGIATRGATVLVALLSISNCLCRVAAGYASDRTAARGVPRSALLAAVSVAMAGAHLLGLPASKGSVYVLSVLSGGAYGAVATVHPLVAADRFGVAHLGAIYASITTANGLGSYLGSNVLAARLYDAANAPGHQVCESSARGTSCDCVGARCFADTFLVCAALNGAAALCCVVLARREARRRTAVREEAGARVEAAAPRAPYYPPVAPPSADAVDFARLASDDESDAEGGPGDGGLDDDATDDASEA